MRIAVLTYGMNGTRMTGIARYAVELTRAMKRIRSDLEVVLLNPYPESNLTWYREFRTYPMPGLKLLPSVVTVGNWQLHRAAIALGVDVLHDPCGVAPFLAPRAGYKRVVTIHDAVPFVYPRTQPLLTRMVFRTLLRVAGRTADAILTVSEAAAIDLGRYLRLPSQKLHVTPLGVHEPMQAGATEAKERLTRLGVDAPYFLFVGALHPRKNLHRVVDAFHSVRACNHHVQLVIVGPRSWGANALARGLESEATADSGIVLTGFAQEQDLQALYSKALALVFPSLYEGFGLPALEAMSHGTPVIASRAASLPEVVGDAGILVDPTSTEQIACAMRRFLSDPELRSRLGELGRQRAAKMSWEATAHATLRVFDSLLDA